MTSPTPDTEELVERASRGDSSARQELLVRHRDRLRNMVRVRLDCRLAARVDPSDVVQEALLDAAGQLSDYLRRRPLPFYPWLRRLAWEHLVRIHQRHLAKRRSVLREEGQAPALSNDSVQELAQRLVASGTSPSNQLIRKELRERVRRALSQIPETDREVLVLRYLEKLSVADVAAVLGVSAAAVKMRHRRALDRLSRLLADDIAEEHQ